MVNIQIDDESELRLIEPIHARALNSLVRDNFDHLRRWSGWLRIKNRPIEVTRQWIDHNRLRQSSGDGYEIGIWHGGQMAGQIGYNYIDRENRRTDIGYWLGKSFEGKGLITRACAALIDNAFDNMHLNRVEIRCGDENYRSRRVPERLGFVEEGTARQAEWLHDKYIDLVVYAMLSDRWKADRRSRAALLARRSARA